MKDLLLVQSWKSAVYITEHVKYSSALTAKTTITRHPNASNLSLAVTAQLLTSQKNVKANLQLSVLRTAVTMKLTTENAMKGKKRLFVLQQLAYQPQIDIPLYPPPPPPPNIPYFSSRITILLPTNSTNADKKQLPKFIQNRNALQCSLAPKNRNTIPTTSEPWADVNTQSQAGSKRHSSQMDSPENSQKEHNKRRPTISKDARPPLAEKSINIQCVSGKTPGSKDPLPTQISLI